MNQQRFRLLMIEDNTKRIERIRTWMPEDCLLVVAVSAGKAIGVLSRDSGYVYGGVLLDHDLQEQILTEVDHMMSGSDVLKSLITHLSRDVPILVHSMNPTRAPQLVQRLKGAGFEVTRITFQNLDRETFLKWLEDARYNWADAHGIADTGA